MKKECFSDNPSQKNLSIFVDTGATLPEWVAVATKEDFTAADAGEYHWEFEEAEPEDEGTKLGGTPCFLHCAQASQFLKGLNHTRAEYIAQLDEEDFPLTDTPGIPKAIRDILCGGVLYIFAPVDTQAGLIGFSACRFDHQM